MRAYWLSSRSWILDEDSFAMRPNHAHLLQGISSGVIGSTLVVRAQPSQTPRRMVEIFTESGYSIIDHEAKLVTTDGILRVSEIKRRFVEGVDTHLELYMGEVRLRDLESSHMRRPPHGEYLPADLQPYLLAQLLPVKEQPVRVPRPLFPQLYWLVQYLSQEWNGRISVTVENRTFPCEAVLDIRSVNTSLGGSARALAITDYQEKSAVQLQIEDRSFYPCCDGLLLA